MRLLLLKMERATIISQEEARIKRVTKKNPNLQLKLKKRNHQLKNQNLKLINKMRNPILKLKKRIHQLKNLNLKLIKKMINLQIRSKKINQNLLPKTNQQHR